MPNPSFKPFLNLTTERLILRPLTIDDKEAIFQLRSDDRVNLYIDRPKPQHIHEAETFIHKINAGIEDNKNLYWAISLKEQPRLIGTICLWNFSEDKSVAEFGYELSPDHQGQGLMNEAIRGVIRSVIEPLGLRVVEAYTHQDNVRSAKLLLKNGFVLMKDRKDEENLLNEIYVLEVRKRD